MKNLLLASATVIGMAVCQVASATPILINGPYGQVVIPANATLEYNELLAAIEAYNSIHEPDVPDAGDIDLTPQLIGGAFSSGSGHASMPEPTPLSITIDFGVEQETYVALTWDGPNGGTLFYYVRDETGPVTFPSPFFPAKNGTTKQYGLSHYMFTGAVPDGGMTLALLGCALIGLGALRRMFSM